MLAVARDTSHDDASFRELARSSLLASGLTPEDSAQLCDSRLHFQTIAGGRPDDFRALADRIERLEQTHDLPGNRAFYLALPRGRWRAQSKGWARLVSTRAEAGPAWSSRSRLATIWSSARELIDVVRASFTEEQVYRIDHYLGKETVQNLMVFRFGNAIFESMWNRQHIESVQITVAEDLGVGTRAGYYDKSGALRDMVQNHLTQVLSLVAMEVPSVIGASSVRYEKVKVLQSVAPILPSDVVFGQYAAGAIASEPVRGYLDEDDIPADSQTETFVAMKLRDRQLALAGRTLLPAHRQRLPRRMTRIAVRFRNAPVCMFESEGACVVSHNVLLLTLQPDEGFSLHIDVKKPGTTSDLQRSLSVQVQRRVRRDARRLSELLLDVFEGDQTLFVHSDEVLESWKLYDPLLRSRRSVHPYAAGSYGPDEARHLRIPERYLRKIVTTVAGKR